MPLRNDLAGGLELIAQVRIVSRGGEIERQAQQRRKGGLHFGLAFRTLFILPRSVEQFSPHDGTGGGVSPVGGLKTLTHGDVSAFEVDDPNIGIKQVGITSGARVPPGDRLGPPSAPQRMSRQSAQNSP